MNKILIVESPNKIKKIKLFLDDSWDVKASVGHISDLSTSQGIESLGIKDFDSFEPIYEVSEDKQSVVSNLKKSVKDKNVYLATDPDREGEAIAYHLKNILKLSEKDYQRVTFNEISEKAVKKAIDNPRKIDYELVHAQETRRIVDRIYGFKGSQAIRRLSSDLKSVGRVQSAGLKIVVNRETEIQQFKSVTYKEPALNINDTEFKLKMDKEKIIEKDWSIIKWPEELEIVNVSSSIKTVNPKKPLTTNDALKVASQLGYQPKYATKILQNLFEAGFITYIRTDSNNVSEDFKKEAASYINKNINVKVDISRKYKSKENSQEGHEAIRPVHIADEGLEIADEDQRSLYKAIWKISLASQMESGEDVVQIIEAKMGEYTFINTSKVVKKEGFRSFYGYSKDSFSAVTFKKGTYKYKLEIKPKSTTAPPRYSETSFLTKIENLGIGRPSTFASILQTILDRNYVASKKGQLVPTEIGFAVIELMEKNFGKLIDLNFTNDLEDKLDEIAKGNEEKNKVLKSFNEKLNIALGKVSESIEKKLRLENGTCPECKKPLRKIKSSHGNGFGCTGYPECNYIKWENKASFNKKSRTKIKTNSNRLKRLTGK